MKRNGYVTIPVLVIALLVVSFWVSFLIPGAAQAKFSADESFARWVVDFRSEALEQGFSPEILDVAFRSVERLQRVIDLDRRQPERLETLQEYLDRRITPQLVRTGKDMLKRHGDLLNAVFERYGVEPQFIVALWGMESRFGTNQGSYPVISSLATLAHEGRRSHLFRKELFHALKILEAGYIPPDQMFGSWAGAMGQCQFLPSSFRSYAVDFDGDQRIDIWTSLPDVFGSISNYLVRHGWNSGQPWGFSVAVPASLDRRLIGGEQKLTLEEWNNRGVRPVVNGKSMTGGDERAAGLVLLDTGKQGYLVFNNYDVFRRWNRSHHFAIALGTLSDALALE